MSSRRTAWWLALVVPLFLLVVNRSAFAEPTENTAGKRNNVKTESARLLAQLQKPVDLEFLPIKLATAAEAISEKTGLQVRLYESLPAEFESVEIEAHTKQQPLWLALDKMLAPRGLDWTISGEYLVLTTPAHAQFTRPIVEHTLGKAFDGKGGDEESIAHLTETIRSLFPPFNAGDDEDIVYPAPTRAHFGIRRNWHVQLEIANLLDRLEHSHGLLQTWDGESSSPAMTLAADEFQQTGNAAVFRALDEPAILDFIETPLEDAIQWLAERHDIKIELELRALEQIGIGADFPITRNLKRISLRSALRLLLKDLELTYVVHGGKLIVTTPEAADEYSSNGPGRVVAVHPVFDLVCDEARQPADGDRLKQLIELIQTTVVPYNWDAVGGSGAIRGMPSCGCLVVGEGREIHDEIAAILGELRAARQLMRQWDGVARVPVVIQRDRAQSPEEKAVWRALEEKTSLDFELAPLHDIADFLSDKHRVPIEINTRALDLVGIGSDTPMTFEIEGVSLRSALYLMLRDLELTFIVQDGVIQITTPEDCEANQIFRLYPIFDLLGPTGSTPGRVPAAAEFDDLTELIMQTLSPESWDHVGGPGSIEFLPWCGCLAVSQTGREHEQIVAFLEMYRDLRRMYEHRMGVNLPQSMYVGRDGWTDDLRARLEANVDELNVKDRPLNEVVKRLAKRYRLPMLLDERALDIAGIETKTPVTIRANREPLAKALRRMLEELELTWIYGHETVVITTVEHADYSLMTRIYPLVHAVPTEQDKQAIVRERLLPRLRAVIIEQIGPDTWDEVGGPGSISTIAHPPALVVSQTTRTHEQLETFLSKLPKLRAR